MFFPLRELAKLAADEFPLQVELDQQVILVRYQAEAPTAWAEDSSEQLLDGVLAYEWGWKRFHPSSRIFSRP
jgi:hypothetical protein